MVAVVMFGYSMFGGSATLLPSPPAQAAAPPLPTAVSVPADVVPSTPVDFPWLFTYGDGLPARWPCGPIGYRLVSTGAPDGVGDLLTEAVGRISAVSGLEFREDATVGAPGPYDGIEVSWVDREELDSSDPTSIGLGGARATDGHYTSGFVKIADDWDGSARAEFGPDGVGPVLLHELGHALGLSHTNDQLAIMYPTDQGNSDWTTAERAALRYLRQTC